MSCRRDWRATGERRGGWANQGMRASQIAFVLLIGEVSSAMAQGAPSMSGEYECAYGCRVTDAAPTLAIDGDVAICTDELGGLFRGKQQPDGAIVCFNKIGRPQGDGKTIVWDGGVVWRKMK
jgi:hypothetical protein